MKDLSDAWNWINHHVKQVNHLLQRWGKYDHEYGLILVTERWSAKNSRRISVHAKETEDGIVTGLTKEGTWIEGFKSGCLIPSENIENYEVCLFLESANGSERTFRYVIC